MKTFRVKNERWIKTIRPPVLDEVPFVRLGVSSGELVFRWGISSKFQRNDVVGLYYSNSFRRLNDYAKARLGKYYPSVEIGNDLVSEYLKLMPPSENFHVLFAGFDMLEALWVSNWDLSFESSRIAYMTRMFTREELKV